MEPLELHAMMRDGGSWYELAARFWAVLTLLAILGFATIVLIVVSSRENSLTGRFLRWLFFLFGAPSADHLFLRVNLSYENAAGDSEVVKPIQAYLSAVKTHGMFIYSKYNFEVGQILKITPPEVDVIVQDSRCISSDPPWFAIEAEPLFRDDSTKRNYRKFIGEISQVA